MKKISILIAVLGLFAKPFASSGFSSLPKNATDILIPIGNNAQISLMALSEIKVADYEKLSGRHLNFFQRLSFKIGQRKIRNSIASDGTISNKNLLKAMADGDNKSSGFDIAGLALGLFLPVIGVLIAYLIGGDEAVKRRRVKWVWIGFGIFLAVLIFLAVKVASAFRG